MADIFRKTNRDREVAAGIEQPLTPPAPAAKPAVDFTRQVPADPAKEAAKQEALKKLLRNR
jgi:hypothetical protein